MEPMGLARRAGIDFYAAKLKAPPKVRTYPARLPRFDDVPEPVHDGDTSWFERDWAGRRKFELVNCRYFNVFAPEIEQTGGPECRAYVKSWIALNGGGKWPFLIDTVLDGNGHEVETLGRVVCIVRSVTGKCLNDDMNAFVDANGFPRGIGGTPRTQFMME